MIEVLNFFRMLYALYPTMDQVSGNISFRSAEDQIMISPTGVKKCELQIKDMIRFPPSDNHTIVSPSVDVFLHCALYNALPNVGGILHLHQYVKNAPYIQKSESYGDVKILDQLVMYAKFPLMFNVHDHGCYICMEEPEDLQNIEFEGTFL